MINTNIKNYLRILLWLVALHSFCVGLGLMFMPLSWFEIFGFSIPTVRFFAAQAGVFHIVMSVAYALGAYNLIVNKQLILFSIIAKFIATIFLSIYFFFIESAWMILLSAIGDFLMGIVICWLFIKYFKVVELINNNQEIINE
ncbi:MAG: hypothetical protein K9J13_02260 [Saprospiraceae bacterium]|nr:hypothetical protein [Saprospiraceae bacterium]